MTSPKKIESTVGRCPVDYTLEIIGGRWKGVIVYRLLSGTKRFGELRKLIQGVSQRMITLQLRELEEQELINRKIYSEIPPKVEYSLTELGQSLEPIINVLMAWGADLQKMRGIPHIEENSNIGKQKSRG